MKKKILLLGAFLASVISEVNGQLKHYISLNLIGYYNYFNIEKDYVFPAPAPSYKIERKKTGIEIFMNWNGIGYNRESNAQSADKIKQIISSNIGIAVHENVFEKKYLKINPMIGIVRCKYNATISKGYYQHQYWTEEYLDGNIETKLGLLVGVNINVPIWKGIYANTNARYIVFPTGQYNKQNLLFELGIGYMYQHKSKKK